MTMEHIALLVAKLFLAIAWCSMLLFGGRDRKVIALRWVEIALFIGVVVMSCFAIGVSNQEASYSLLIIGYILLVALLLIHDKATH